MTATGYVSTTGDSRKVSKSGDTMTGELVLPDSNPDTSLSAASKGYIDTGLAGKASSTHAATHAAAGSDPVTLTQAQVTGLVSALAALLPLAGGTVTGDLTIQGYTTLNGGQFNSDVAAFGDLTLIGTGKRYRLRRSGTNLDFEGAGTDLILSVWSAQDFTGSQRSYFRFSADAQNVQVAGKVEFVDALYGSTKHVLDGAANQVGFFGATPAGRPTVTGSRGGNAALASLLSALASLGLITDGTSA